MLPLLVAHALRAFVDGYVAVLLPAYLLAIGLGTLEIGVVLQGLFRRGVESGVFHAQCVVVAGAETQGHGGVALLGRQVCGDDRRRQAEPLRQAQRREYVRHRQPAAEIGAECAEALGRNLG